MILIKSCSQNSQYIKQVTYVAIPSTSTKLKLMNCYEFAFQKSQQKSELDKVMKSMETQTDEPIGKLIV